MVHWTAVLISSKDICPGVLLKRNPSIGSYGCWCVSVDRTRTDKGRRESGTRRRLIPNNTSFDVTRGCTDWQTAPVYQIPKQNLPLCVVCIGQPPIGRSAHSTQTSSLGSLVKITKRWRNTGIRGKQELFWGIVEIFRRIEKNGVLAMGTVRLRFSPIVTIRLVMVWWSLKKTFR